MSRSERHATVDRPDGEKVHIGESHPDTVQQLLGRSSYAWSEDSRGNVNYYKDYETAISKEVKGE